MKYVVLKTNKGDIKLEVNDTDTPISAENFLQYVEEGYYDNTIFHRVIKNFVIQTGGYDRNLVPKPDRGCIYNEAATGGQHLRGTVGIALDEDPHSGGSQIFINVKDNPKLNHKAQEHGKWGYCVFARVIEGMEIVDQISNVATEKRNAPNKTDDEQDEFQKVPVEPVIIEHAAVILKYNPQTNPATNAIMVAMEQQYGNRFNQKEQTYFKTNDCIKNVRELIEQQKINQTISREQLFAKVLGYIYPIASINTGLHFRTVTTGEKLLWLQLMPKMNKQEKAILHAHKTLARLNHEYDAKSKSQFNINTGEKIKAINQSIESLINAKSKIEVDAAIAQLDEAYSLKRKRILSCCVPTSCETSSTRSFRKLV